MKITFYGHAAFLVEGSKKILIDPFISQNPISSTKVSEIPRVDYILVTHDHADHLGDAYEIAKRDNALIVSIHEIAVAAAEKGLRAEGMNIGGKMVLENGIEVFMTKSVHSSSIGGECGFILTMDGKNIYHSGDTGLTYDMKIIRELFDKIDLAILPVGDRYTMGIPSAKIAIDWISPKIFIPIHYNTWEIINVSDEELKKLKEDLSKKTDVKILKPGESIEI